MSAPENSKPSLRIPPWLRVKLPCSHTFSDTRALVEGLDLHTVCHSAKCPNMFECFSRKTATFLILGNTCTRNCAFCNIGGGIILAPDPEEPARVGKAAAALGLRHAVVTSVTRDDLPDGGSAHFAATIRAIRDSGGVAGLNYYQHFVGDDPTIEGLVRHVEHFLELDGERSLCLGGDMDGCELLAGGMRGLEDVPLLWQDRGYPRQLLEDLFWNNLRRLI